MPTSISPKNMNKVCMKGWKNLGFYAESNDWTFWNLRTKWRQMYIKCWWLRGQSTRGLG
jgi:hypothetical protein